MKKTRLFVGTLIFAGSLAAVYAADPPKLATDAVGKDSGLMSKKGQESPNDAGLKEFAMAQQLVRYGISRNDPLFLISAAKIMKQNPPKTEARSKTTEGGDAADDEKAKTDEDLSTPENVLAKAKEMASGKPETLAMVDSVASYTPPKTRGRVGGPGKTHDRVRRGGVDLYSLRFVGGQLAQVAVIGDGDTDLDCAVIDQHRNVVVTDTDYSDECALSWTPDETANFVVVIKNQGRVSNRYVLLTN